jgi:uncharacterized coiled-coil DUF342 family protein
MEPTDLTIEILKGIREEVHGLRGEAHKTNERLDQTNERLDDLRDRQTATEVRLATELVGVAGAVREVRDLLRQDLGLRARVDDHERRIAAMERRTG